MKILWVGLGGGAGAILRHIIGVALKNQNYMQMPISTTFINVLGCFLMGLFSFFFLGEKWENYRLLLITGFCGGFTTFSTYAMEQKEMQQSGIFGAQMLHLLLNNILGIIFVVLGHWMAKKWS